MAAFRDGPGDRDRLDYRLLRCGPIALYWSRRILDEDVRWLMEHGYRIDALDARLWVSPSEGLASLAQVLGFPDYFGGNLDALNDCLADLSVPDDAGRAVVLEHYDGTLRRHGDFARAVLDIFASQCRAHLLHGRRLVVLLHSDDPRLQVPPVGATSVAWNPREFLDSSRGA